ncbi:unnamed protein product, partial [Mesorhabditis spiculigera]
MILCRKRFAALPPSPRPARTPQRRQCGVCGEDGDGMHFGAYSCAACGAFFRRSIQEQKVYSCDSRQCYDYRVNTTRVGGGHCRYCRFQKCLTAGMLVTEVHVRRQRQDGVVNQPDAFLWERSRVQLHVDELSIEWHLFSEHLIHHPLFQRIRDLDWLSYEGGPPTPEPSRAYTDFFYLHYVFELVLATVRGGGVQMDACITTTGLKIDADMESLTIFYSASPLADPVCMARLAQPFFEHLIRTCAKALQALQLDETETAYVHYIITTSWLTFQQNDSATCRGILCQELHRHYSAREGVIGTKLGNLCLTASFFLEALFNLREYVTVMHIRGLIL